MSITLKEMSPLGKRWKMPTKEGKIRAIGVSNFEQADLQNLFDYGTIKPMVNQILAHIGSYPFDLIDYCQKIICLWRLTLDCSWRNDGKS